VAAWQIPMTATTPCLHDNVAPLTCFSLPLDMLEHAQRKHQSGAIPMAEAEAVDNTIDHVEE
jgi:hypothetical protein